MRGSAPPNITFSPDASRKFRAILKGPGAFQPAMAWASTERSLKSERYESTTAVWLALSATPRLPPESRVAVDVAPVDDEVVRHGVGRRLALPKPHERVERDAFLRRNLQPHQPEVVCARFGFEHRAGCGNELRHPRGIRRRDVTARLGQIWSSRRDDDPVIRALRAQAERAAVRRARFERDAVAAVRCIERRLEVAVCRYVDRASRRANLGNLDFNAWQLRGAVRTARLGRNGGHSLFRSAAAVLRRFFAFLLRSDRGAPDNQRCAQHRRRSKCTIHPGHFRDPVSRVERAKRLVSVMDAIGYQRPACEGLTLLNTQSAAGEYSGPSSGFTAPLARQLAHS